MEWFDRPLYRWGAYIVFTLVAFVLALLLTFPDAQVKRIAAVQIEHQLEENMQTGYTVDVADLDPWWIGLQLEGVSIEERGPTPESGSFAGDENKGGDAAPKDSKNSGEAEQKSTDKKGGSSMKVEISSIGARFAPLGSILNGGLSVRYHLGFGGGAVSGAYTRASGAQYVELSIVDLDLEKSPVLEQLTGIPMFGRLDGYGTFTLAVDRPVVTDGNFELTGKKITVGPKAEFEVEALQVGHIKVPQVNFGNLELKLNIESEQKGRPTAVLEQFRSKGRDLRLQIWGTMDLAGQIGRADTELKTRIRFDPEFAQKNQPIRAVQRHQKFQNGQSGEWYGLVFVGPLNDLQWKGSPTAANGPSEGGPESDSKGSGPSNQGG